MIDRETKREFDYIISHFEEHFNIWKGKRIALHGALEAAQVIIAHFHHEYTFVGIVAYDNTQDASGLGLRVLKQGDLSTECDILILTEFRVYADQAFFDLTADPCLEHVQIYSMFKSIQCTELI